MKLIILDRDGVINQDSDAYIKSVDEWQAIPGSIEAIARLCQAGYRIAIATNQSGLSRGLFSIDDLNAMHRKMYRELSIHGAQIDAIFFCPHGPDEGCTCRKPKHGLFEEISARMQMGLAGVPCVGDAYRDILAARAVGAVPMLVRTGKGERTLKKYPQELFDTPVYADLAEVVESLLRM